LLPFPAKALADNNNELPTNRVKSLVTFICNSLFFSPGAGALETTLRPAEGFDLMFPLLRWLRPVTVRTQEAAKFVLGAENNFMVESGWFSICALP